MLIPSFHIAMRLYPGRIPARPRPKRNRHKSILRRVRAFFGW